MAIAVKERRCFDRETMIGVDPVLVDWLRVLPDWPRARLVVAPTPIHPLARLSAELDGLVVRTPERQA